MKTIIVGYDDTEPAKRALTRTAELAMAYKARAVVISAAPALTPASHGFGPSIPRIHPSSIVSSSSEQRPSSQSVVSRPSIESLSVTLPMRFCSSPTSLERT
jgi:hypothetical protein